SLNNVYSGGFTRGSLEGANEGGPDTFLAKYDSAGNLLWTSQVGTPASDSALGVATDALGNAYLSGHTGGALGGANAGESDSFLMKFSAVPEPASLELLVLGIGFLLLMRRL